MAWTASLLMLILLLLAIGSWAKSYSHEVVWAVQGQAVSVKCSYPFQNGEYKNKTWCWQTKTNYCANLITSSGPLEMAQSPPYFLWDNPARGFFIVTMLAVGKNDIGHYWCGITGETGISIIKNISVMMYPVPTFSTGVSESSFPDNSFPVLLSFGLLIVTKVLALTAFLMFLSCRSWNYINAVGIVATAALNPVKSPGPKGTAS